ncbi:MAG: phage shock protein operon transcriptional activator [Desulfobacterales bacterium]|nr:phage shock protein operon transcriptional activator [Desulfobacterales bacterium]
MNQVQPHDGRVATGEALGQSDAFIRFQEQISRVAPINRPVLVLGERGTGKELAASRIHFLSKRWDKPFVTLNCSALTPTLIESELFGYEKGAFSGAITGKTGRFETASGGTLFLDEIGTIPMVVQEKILRVVEYGSFERVGSSTPTHVDVRIVAATNADLSAMANQGTFKPDLLDRLSFEVIYVPPLRYRTGDIRLLSNHFAARMVFEMEQDQSPEISAAAMRRLENHNWPGNIRELKNVVERAVYRSRKPVIDDISFDPFEHPYGSGLEKPTVFKPGRERPPNEKTDRQIDSQPAEPEPAEPGQAGSDTPDPDLRRLMADIEQMPYKQAVEALEIYLVSKALAACRFNQKRAAEKLGLTYDQFRGVKRKHRIG